MIRHCIGCNTKIILCNGFTLARDILEDRRPPRELCGKCAWRCENNPQLLDLLTEEESGRGKQTHYRSPRAP